MRSKKIKLDIIKKGKVIKEAKTLPEIYEANEQDVAERIDALYRWLDTLKPKNK